VADEAGAELQPLEAHVVALRAELERTQLTLRLATGVLLGVALLLAWQAIREGMPT
jgi:hypothetical protein